MNGNQQHGTTNTNAPRPPQTYQPGHTNTSCTSESVAWLVLRPLRGTREARISSHGSGMAMSAPHPPASYSYHAAPTYSASANYGAASRQYGSPYGNSKATGRTRLARAIVRDAPLPRHRITRRSAATDRPRPAVMVPRQRIRRAAMARALRTRTEAAARTQRRAPAAVAEAAITVVEVVVVDSQQWWRWTPLRRMQSDETGSQKRLPSFLPVSRERDSEI